LSATGEISLGRRTISLAAHAEMTGGGRCRAMAVRA
jgi:hypothetical protein